MTTLTHTSRTEPSFSAHAHSQRKCESSMEIKKSKMSVNYNNLKKIKSKYNFEAVMCEL